MTNHELTLHEREKAKEHFQDVLEKRRSRRKELNQKVQWLEGERKLVKRPEVVLYYPWIQIWSKVEESDPNKISKLLRFEQVVVPEVREFKSRKDYASL